MSVREKGLTGGWGDTAGVGRREGKGEHPKRNLRTVKQGHFLVALSLSRWITDVCYSKGESGGPIPVAWGRVVCSPCPVCLQLER